MALGQVIGAVDAGQFSAKASLIVVAFTVFDLVFVVLLNDWADRDVDALKRRLFPHSGSPKTIPDGLLPAARVLRVALASGLLSLGVAVCGMHVLGRPWLGVLGGSALGLFVFYSLPPVALNYRGGGELLEAIGVGLLLPWFGAYAQSGRLFTPGMAWLAGLFSLSFASAVASGLSDEESDHAGGKRTFTTLLGNPRARRLAEGSVMLGLVSWGLVPAALDVGRAAWLAVPVALVSAVHLARVLRASSSAITSAFAEQRAYKHHLHRAIWDGTALLGFGLAALRLALR